MMVLEISVSAMIQARSRSNRVDLITRSITILASQDCVEDHQASYSGALVLASATYPPQHFDALVVPPSSFFFFPQLRKKRVGFLFLKKRTSSLSLYAALDS